MFKKTKAGYREICRASKELLALAAMQDGEVRYEAQSGKIRNMPAFLGKSIRYWIARGARVVYPDVRYNSFVVDTDSVTKVSCRDLRQVFPSFYLYVPNGISFMDNSVVCDGFMAFFRESESDGISMQGNMTDVALMMFVRRPGSKMTGIEHIGFRNSDSGNIIDQYVTKDWKGYTDEYFELVYGDISRERHAQAMRLVLNMAINYMLLMQETPEYVVKECSRKMTVSVDKVKSDEFKSKEYSMRYGAELSLRQRLPEEPTKHDSHEPTGPHERHVSETWRRAHWRRQPHGLNWIANHPKWTGKLGSFGDGRQYHLIYQPLTKIHYDKAESVA